MKVLVNGREERGRAKQMVTLKLKRHSAVQEVWSWAGWERPLWGDSDLTSALPSWSRQHNPGSEHLHCLNFILWCCLLIGQTWLTASELQSDRQGASRTTAQNSSWEGAKQLHSRYMQLRPTDVSARPVAGLGVGGPRRRLGGGHEGREVGQAQSPK